MRAMSRKLIGYLWTCGDPSCGCTQPVIDEVWEDADGEHRERFFEGTFYADPAPYEYEFLAEELAEAAQRHGLAQDSFDPERWERDL